MKAFFRGSLATLVGSVALFGASTAFAQDACLNDTDCPGGGMVCGGDVCNWHKPLTAPADPNKPYTCNPAGTDPKGSDGWCTGPTADNCKCKGEGAKCVGTYCSFTKASDALAGSGGSGAGGSAAGGSPSSAGTTAAAGTPTAAAGTPTAAAGTGTTPAASSDSGGCSVSAPIGTRGGAALALGVLGLGFALSRRRR
jgi:MYXO-CTERM domain-containing protein